MKALSWFSAIFLLISCSPLTLNWPSGETGFIPDYSRLPRGIRPVEGDASYTPADLELTTTTVLSADMPEFALSREFLVPTAYWLDLRESVSSADIGEDDPMLVRLTDLALPVKLLAVEGKYPGDDGYPLVEWTTLNTEGPALSDINERQKRELAVWLADEASRSLDIDRSARPDPHLFHLAAVGDIMPGRGFGELLLGPNGVDEALGDVAPLLTAPDLLIGNLETAVTESEEAVDKSYNFKVSGDVLDAVAALGFDFFHLANNHGWDYGEKGFRDTLAALRQTGAGFSGAGLDLEGARFAWEREMPGSGPIRVLSLGAYFTERNGFDGASSAAAGEGKPGVLWDSPENEDFIRSILARDDAFTVVTVHGGYEWEDEPREDVKALYHRYVDWGADLVLAHHPHVLQGMEYYNGALIAYSLGNFIFPGMTGWYTGEETGILDFRLYNGRIVGVDFHPVRIDDIRLRRAEGEGIGERFREMSGYLTAVSGP